MLLAEQQRIPLECKQWDDDIPGPSGNGGVGRICGAGKMEMMGKREIGRKGSSILK